MPLYSYFKLSVSAFCCIAYSIFTMLKHTLQLFSSTEQAAFVYVAVIYNNAK